MIKEVFFQSSLPRSGSTLLQNILGQNPDFYPTPTSGLLELFAAARGVYSNSPEFRAQDEELMKKAWKGFCKGGLHGYFDGITDKPYAIDKCRAWGAFQDFLDWFYPNPKIFCMVRDPRGVFASMEKNHRREPEKTDEIPNISEMKGLTVGSRIDHWNDGPLVGGSFQRLEDIFHKGQNEYMHFIRFEDLCADPETEIRKLYEYLEVDYYKKHDYKNVKQVTIENDRVHGRYGDHNIRKEIKPVKPSWNKYLGEENSNKILQHYSWFNQIFNYPIN